MNNQNSKGCSDSRLHPFAILQHGLEVKRSIQNEIFDLIEILKRREYDLCLEVDQQCLDLLCEAEVLGKFEPPVLNGPNHELDKSIQYIKNRDLLTSKLKFNGDLEFCQRVLKNYGDVQKIDCQKKDMCKPKTNDKLPEDIKTNLKKGSFEMINPPQDNDGKESSVSSIDSFEVLETLQDWCHPRIKTDQQLNELFAMTLPKIDDDTSKAQLATSASSETTVTTLNYKTPPFSSLARPLCTVRMQNKNEWLANVVQKNSKTPIDGKIQSPSCGILSEIGGSPVSSQSCPGSSAEVAGGDNPQSTIEASFGAYLKQTDLKLWLKSNQANQDGPQNTIKACFGDYFKPNDLGLWLSPNYSFPKIDQTLFENWMESTRCPVEMFEPDCIIDY